MAKTLKKSAVKKASATKKAQKKAVSKPKAAASAKTKRVSRPSATSQATKTSVKGSTTVKNTESSKKTTAKKTELPPMKLTANDNDVIANAKVRYSAKDLEFFKKELLSQREEAKEEFDIISHQLLDTSGEYDAENQSFALHTAEQGSDAMEREKQYLQAQRTSDFIKKLDEALERIDRGVYGICVVCGELIEKPRLMAVPITQKHVTCKNKTQAKKFAVSETYNPMAEENIE